YIPELQTKSAACRTGQRHRFQIARGKKKLRITLLDAFGRPRKRVPCLLVVDGKVYAPANPKSSGKSTVYPLTTDDKGLVEAEFPDGACEAALLVGENPDVPEVIQLLLGGLDPIDEIRGVQERLSNLGFYSGTIDGVEGLLTRDAVLSFQEWVNLSARRAV